MSLSVDDELASTDVVSNCEVVLQLLWLYQPELIKALLFLVTYSKADYIKITTISIFAFMVSFFVGLPSLLNVKTAKKTVSPVAIKIN